MTEADALLAQALAALDGGQLATAADRFERAARILAPARRADALHALESAVRLALMLGDPARAGELIARARELDPDAPTISMLAAELADARGDADARRAAWEAVVRSPDSRHRYRALLRLGALARDAGAPALAAVHLTTALAELPADASGTAHAELLLELAAARTAADDREGAERSLSQAEAQLADSDDDDVALVRARITGQRGVLALAAGDLETALRLAQLARDAAVARDDVMTYLGAAALIAMVHERADRLVDAYDTYVRARESLGQLQGDAGRSLVAPAIELFEQRLGAERFATVWNQWVERRRAP